MEKIEVKKFNKASSRARKVSTSKSFVGSSNNNKLPPLRKVFAK